ncbi:MAG: hypothetical protein AAFW73_23255 [Bacteroidota bacterium]
MNSYLKIVVAALLVGGLFTRETVCRHLGFGSSKHHPTTAAEIPVETVTAPPAKAPQVGPPESVAVANEIQTGGDTEESIKTNNLVDDYTYRWDDEVMNWVVVQEELIPQAQLASPPAEPLPDAKPIKVDWQVLMKIQYQLSYFEALEMEIYTPVFTEAVQSLHGKEVILEGFVIPFDEEAEVLALSYNPYASCFFCGKASPASVISMYLKSKRKRYKVDDFKKFRGTLYLNYDDPNEFYYILRNAREV